MKDLTLGIDFGTTNSSLAVAGEDGRIHAAGFTLLGAQTPSFRSVLYLEQHRAPSGMRRAHSFSGPTAIERYLEAQEKGRLIQSLKSHLASRSLTGAEIFGRRYKLEDLLARLLGDLRVEAERQFAGPVRRALVGRPVRFVGSNSADDDLFAQGRLLEAFHLAGFESVAFELEPVAAARAYEQSLTRDELILIGDFGGGTSDFSLLRVGPGIRQRGRRPDDLLGNRGLGLAGDDFDARIVRKLVSPELGSDSLARSMGKHLPAVPAWIYSNLERWHHLSFLRTNNVREILKGARVRALEPEKIEALSDLIEEDLGYQLHQSVGRVKCELSAQEGAQLRFRQGSLDLAIPVRREEFESWIAPELDAIARCVDELLSATGVQAQAIDRVFLTGGTSFVPAVRRIFSTRFGEEKLRGGNEFVSVAHGLALGALEGGRWGA